MKSKGIKVAIASVFALALSTTTLAQEVTWVGGEQMYPKKDIVTNAVNSKDHTTLVAAVNAAGLVETLQGDGPFTVFAPTNDAFENLPDGTVNTLLKKENKEMLTGILTYHVVAGTWDTKKLMAAIDKSKDGTVELKTVSGGKLWVMRNGKSNLIVKDEKGNMADITITDVYQSNGVIQVIDAVLMPS